MTTFWTYKYKFLKNSLTIFHLPAAKRSATARCQNQLDHTPIDLSDGNIRPSKAVRDLGVMIDSQLSFAQAREQHRLQMLRQAPSNQIIPPFPTNRCRSHSSEQSGSLKNWLLQLPACGQRQQISRTSFNLSWMQQLGLCVASRNTTTSQVTCEIRLHWLRVPQRVTFKLCLLTYKSLHGCAPDYLTELCNPVARSEPRRRLRSAAVGDLIIARTTTSFGDRAFAHAGPHKHGIVFHRS